MRVIPDLAGARATRGWSQARLAAAAGISRQSYAAIETGNAVPSTEVALRLARVLGTTVEGLFRLPNLPAERIEAILAGEGEPLGRRVRLARVAGRIVAWPTGQAERPNAAAAGVVCGGAGVEVSVSLLADRPPVADLAVVGCDPAFGIVAEALRGEAGVEVVWSQRGSRAAIGALARGEAHVAGAHLRDPETGEMNGPWLREAVPFPCTRVHFAIWEQGLLVTAGNPAGITAISDLARPDLRFLNREPGSGSRMLLDESLVTAGLAGDAIVGYETAARGHLAVGEAIASGLADAGVGIRAAGAAFGLDVVPLRAEAYELIIPDHFLDLPAVGALLDLLRRPGIRAQVDALQGYDTVGMGRNA